MVLLKRVKTQGDIYIKLIDFGTATETQKYKKNPTGLVGTLIYMAPEIIKKFYN